MREDTSRDGDLQREESLEDLVYRPCLSQGKRSVRTASAWLSWPLTLVGYAILGLVGWMLAQQARKVVEAPPATIAVDLTDPEPPDDSANERTSAPAAAGAPPPGALQKADAPPPRITPDVPPEKPPTELPKADLSGVAVPAAPPGTPPGQGTGTQGTGHGSNGVGDGDDEDEDEPAVKVVRRVNEALKIKFQPPDPPYPENAKRAGVQGKVKVEVRVGKDGMPISARAIEGPKMLHSSVEAFAMKHRWFPEIENGEAVEVKTFVSITYSLTNP